MNMIGAHPEATWINEPLIGVNLAPFMSETLSAEPRRYNDVFAGYPHAFFGAEHAGVWRPLVRDLILGRLAVHAGDHSLVVVKDPNGSQGADVVMSVLPRSRLLFLLRDGRDVVDSEVASLQPDAWRGRDFDLQVSRLELIEHCARSWLARTEIVERAFARHSQELRLRVRYEELVAAPTSELADVYAWCGLVADQGTIRKTVESLSLKGIEGRSQKTFVRTATPGLWRESFDEREQALLGSILGDKLRELGYDTG
jgi:hypothetical protein